MQQVCMKLGFRLRHTLDPGVVETEIDLETG
jgi:hypothetical protein